MIFTGTRFKALTALGVLALAATSLSAQSASWNKQVTKLVAANFSYPRSAQVRGDQGSALIRVDVAPNGNITAVSLVQSSGSPILDREALRIVQKVGQLPTPPAGTKTISLPIVFRLQ